MEDKHLRVAASQDPTNPTGFATEQGVYRTYGNLANGFADMMLTFYQEKYGRSDTDD